MKNNNHRTQIAIAAALAALFIGKDAFATPLPGCDNLTWMAVRQNPSQACPTIPGNGSGTWFVQDPFETIRGTTRATNMCMYVWTPSKNLFPPAKELKKLFDLAGNPPAPLVRLEQSCIKTAGMSDHVPALMVPNVRGAFLKQTNVTNLPTGPQEPVHIALIDSLPDHEGLLLSSSPHHSHGRALGMTIRDVACPGDPPFCNVHFRSRLAFRRLDECPNCTNGDRGGYAGRPADLAVAIHRAVEAWRADAPDERLIINLSVGWRAASSPLESPQFMETDTLAVFHALGTANCRGALIFAAAGNTTEGPNPINGPLFPGAYQQRPAPTHAECLSEYGIHTNPALRSENGPLIYAVGGLDGVDREMGNARPGARPQLGAPGELAAQSQPASYGPAYENVMSGTSVATAVASAAAALAWSYKKDATAVEIADRLYSSGESLLESADFCLTGTTCGEVKRISMCGLLQAVCSDPASTCTTPPSCTVRPAFANHRPCITPAQASQLQSLLVEVNQPETQTHFVPECNADVTMPVGSTDIPCPQLQYETAMSEPAIHPQPGETPCRICALARINNNEYKLFISINPQLKTGTTATNGSIELIYPNGDRKYRSLQHNALDPSQELQIPLTLDQGFYKASISFLVHYEGSTSSSRDPLILD